MKWGFGGGKKQKENPVLYHRLGSVIVSAVLIYTKIRDPGAWLIAKGSNPAPGLVCFVNCSLR